MKKKILAYLVLIPFISFAQIKGDITIEWIEKQEMSFGDFKINLPQFTGNCYNYNASEKALFYTLTLPELNSFNENSIQITNVVYESISTSQLGDLNPAKVPKNPSPSLKTTQSRNLKQNFLTISPIVKDEFGFKRIKSFSYSINIVSNSRMAQTNKSTGVIYNSVLASGDWYQFYVEKSGVYKISKSFLQQLGLDVGSVNPKKIKLYGNGGKMLPLSNSIYYPTDLTENAIEIVGESDGIFNNEDYILFYAEGVDTWNQESQTNLNLYDTKSYYYITVQGNDGKRIPNMVQPTGASTLNLSTFDDYQFHELDLINIARLGRQWFGEAFDIKQDQEFSFSFPNIDTTAPIKLNIAAGSASFTPTSFKVSANESNVGTISFPALVPYSGTEFNTASLPGNTSFAGSENVKIKISYDNNGVPGSKGYLDRIELTAKRKLQGYGKQFQFQYNLSSSSLGIVSYTISNATGISRIWDVTDLYNVTKVENQNQASFTFKANLGEPRKYVAIDALDYFTPLKSSKTKIANQNLKGTLFKNNQGQFQDIDYVIITPAFLTSQAEKLANFHRSYSNLNVKVIPLETIYQEFSSGKQDIAAIRNCIKYIYENASTPEKKIKYVNLFGDASYDYKNRTPNNSNIVPIYQALNSNTSGESSFASDDFYGLMDSNEGNITSSFGGIDIAVGRMLNNDAAQAEEMVNKVLEYHDIKSYGSWRN
ncbi:MAG: type IX secretion system sortase PorU, partial [Flavobacterium sp.]|nr:type IX secretion system sortase PorU [Flavobacterium sp.]